MPVTNEIFPLCPRCGWPDPDTGQIEEFRLRADSVTSFLMDEGYIPDENDYILLPTLKMRYQKYCERKSYEPRAGKEFAERLEENGITVATWRGDRVAFLGVAV
jgi:hypothetical protein